MRLWFALLACSLVACATSKQASAPSPTPEASTEAPAQKPQSEEDVAALLGREAKPQPTRQLRSADGKFTLTTEAGGEPTFSAETEGMATAEIPVGTASPLTCFVYPHRIDPAGALSLVVGSISEGPIQVQSVVPTHVAVLNETPVMFVRMDYLTKVEGRDAGGQVKLAVSAQPDVSLLCVHDEVGYSKSFQRWVGAIAGSLKRQGSNPEPARFREVQIMTFNQQPVGFDQRSLYQRGDARVMETYSSMLIPRSASQVVASDNVTIEEVDAKGQVTQATYVKSMNNEVSSNITLKKAKKGYQYRGTWEGKPLEGTIASKDPVAGEILQWQRVRELLAGKKDAVSVATYSPSVDPTNVSQVVYRKAGGRERGLQMELGPMKLSGAADERGAVEWYEMPLGRMTIRSERAFVRGKL